MAVTITFRSWTKSGPPRSYDRPPTERLRASDINLFLLSNESWNDYGYYTDFLVHVLVDRTWRMLGSMSIGRVNQATGTHTYELLGRPRTLKGLGDDYFSLGHDLEFYEDIRDALGTSRGLEALRSLRDIATNQGLRHSVEDEDVVSTSLLRSNASLEALEQASSLFGLDADASLTESFDAEVWLEGADAPHQFHFDFGNEATVASQINVLVGLNGTGKTQSMATLARLLSRVTDVDARSNPETDLRSRLLPRPSIYGVVAVSFSAFDDFVVPKPSASKRFKYSYCGLRSLDAQSERSQVGEIEVGDRFKDLSTADRLRALEALGTSLAGDFDADVAASTGHLPYEFLSAGQRIVLSIACDLLAKVSNRTLVLMDEPELHLHPQLLSHLLSYTNGLLQERNSFAIISTHSPIVVQQVPARSVQIIRRDGRYPYVSRPSTETFGANLTEIVREVFEDRSADLAYQEVLQRLLDRLGSVDRVRDAFDGRLGLNADIYLRSLNR